MHYKLNIDQESIEKAKKFSLDVVNETYDRFHKDLEEREKRIFFGKLGELIFSKFLLSKGIKHNTKGMLEVFPGTSNVDAFDFIIPKNKKLIDVKTAYKNFHKRIIIPYDQFENGKAKDFYVGIFIDFEKKESTIYGYTTKEKMSAKEYDFGEGLGYWVYLEELMPIDELLQMFH